jgi:hypothetical protein
MENKGQQQSTCRTYTDQILDDQPKEDTKGSVLVCSAREETVANRQHPKKGITFGPISEDAQNQPSEMRVGLRHRMGACLVSKGREVARAASHRLEFQVSSSNSSSFRRVLQWMFCRMTGRDH